MIEWAVQLEAYDDRYSPRHALEAQALEDFTAQLTPIKEMQPDLWEKWKVRVDGASDSFGSSVRGSNGRTASGEAQIYGKAKFQYNNKVTKYEALLMSLQILKKLKEIHATICSDSQLVFHQCHGNYQVKLPSLSKYKLRVKTFLVEVQMKGGELSIIQIPWSENGDADNLAEFVTVGEHHSNQDIPFEEMETPIVD